MPSLTVSNVFNLLFLIIFCFSQAYIEYLIKSIQNVKTYPSPFLVVSHGAVWMELCVLLGMAECLIANCEPLKVFEGQKNSSFSWNWEKLSFLYFLLF